MKTTSWRNALAIQLPLMGHRNWIGVVDSAYPWQTAPGIETVATGAEHLSVLRHVLDTIGRTDHVRPLIRIDSEFAAVEDSLSPGVTAMRKKLLSLLEKHDVATAPHDQTIRSLDEAAKLFRVLLFKSTLTIPYTSVFLELDCGYWSAAAEKTLRKSLSQKA